MTARAERSGATTLAHLALLAAAAMLNACSSLPDEPVPPPLDGTHWRLVALPGHSLPADGSMTLAFEGARAAGSDGCNRYTVPTTSSGPELRFATQPASTLMACPDDVRQRADAYRRALGEVRRYRVRDTGPGVRLELLDGAGRAVAVFIAQSQVLAGTQWEVNGIHDGRQAVASVLPDTRVTLGFDNQGRVSGSAGCNRFTAQYTGQGGRIRIDAPAATRMACPAPGVMDQERAFLRALEAARTARIEAGRLELRDDAGALQVSAEILSSSR